jgi:choline kinase
VQVCADQKSLITDCDVIFNQAFIEQILSAAEGEKLYIGLYSIRI